MVAFAVGTAFLYYLSTSFKGPEEAKFLMDPFFADVAKEYQPGLQPQFYYKKPKGQQQWLHLTL